MTEKPGPYIEFRDVRVEYADNVKGLRGVSLDIAKGDFVFFVGRTGAGKSTLIKLLTREIRPTSGLVIFDGREIGHLRDREIPALRRQMGIVPQDFALLPRKRVWENVAYALRAVGATRREVRRRVPEILDQVQITHRADAFPHQLSGGEQQRVAIARALINNPPLLVADEPTGNLDPDHSWGIMELLLGLNLRGTTVLVASHDMMVIHRVGKRVVTLEGGQVFGDVRPEPARRSEIGSPASASPPGFPRLATVSMEQPETSHPQVADAYESSREIAMEAGEPESVIPPPSESEASPLNESSEDADSEAVPVLPMSSGDGP